MKRFVISEDERRRILSMHESATKRQYLSEQSGGISNVAAKAIYDKAMEYYNSGKKKYQFTIPETPNSVYWYDWPRDFDPGSTGFFVWKPFYDKNTGSITIQNAGDFQISSPNFVKPGETPVYSVRNMESTPLTSNVMDVNRYPIGDAGLTQGAAQYLIKQKFNELTDDEKNKFIQYAKNKPLEDSGLKPAYTTFINTLASTLNSSSGTTTTNTTNTAG